MEGYSRTKRAGVEGMSTRRADQWRWRSQELEGFTSSRMDLIEQRPIEAALRESEERFRTLADNIAQLAWMADQNGEVFWYNQRWFDYTGTNAEQMRRNGWKNVPHPDHMDRVVSKFERCIETGEAWEDTFPMRGSNGEYRWFLSRALPTRDASGRIVRWLGTNTDITEQRQVEELLRESDQRKDEYLAMLGHELRNPLAGITGAVELAKASQNDDPHLQHAVEVLERQSGHIARIVDDLLEVSRISRGKIQLKPSLLNLRELVESVVQDRIPHLEKWGLQLEEFYPPEPVWVAGDWVRLVQVLDNLLGNAIKFTQAPGVIAVTLETRAGYALIRVRDTGVGIRREMLSRIFEPFLQETQDIARAAGGLGLGLALARSLVELHRGSIEARSEGADTGAEFLVQLPLPSLAEQELTASTYTAARQKSILIVEDNPDAGDTLASLLKMKGHAVLMARNGAEAFNLLNRQVVDVVLCDIGLPGMSGYEFARALRADQKLCEILLVAVTGYGQPEDRKRSLQAGFDEHLTKPVAIEALEKLISAPTDSRAFRH